MDKLKSIVAALRSKPADGQAMLGQGMAQDAAKTMQTVPAYREYVMQTQTIGQQPMSLQEYMSKMQVK